MRISDWSSDVCSSDLSSGPGHRPAGCGCGGTGGCPHSADRLDAGQVRPDRSPRCRAHAVTDAPDLRRCARRLSRRTRSEEHTSELQSLMRISYAVFCLKKKNRTEQVTTIHKPKQQKQKQTSAQTSSNQRTD